MKRQEEQHAHENTSTSTFSSSDEKNPTLTQLLKQLRPFQREAYDFATKGLIATRQWNSSTNKDNTSNKDRSSIVYDKDLLGKGRILLADEMGLGKTVTSLAIMAHYKQEWPLLILCPASLRYTWPGEIEKFIPSLPASAIYVVSGFDDADFFENGHKRDKIQIVVATYSLLQKRSAAAKTLAQFDFQCVIADESHNLKQKNSQRTQLAMPLLQHAKRLVLLSGTPALARPVELWTQASVIAPHLFGDNYTQFTKTYCAARRGRFGWDVSGLSNAKELHGKLRQIMVRRLKSDVLTELPPKQRSIVPIQIPNGDKRKECASIMKELTETRQSVDDLVGDEANGAHLEARRLLMQSYQCSGIAKSPGVCDYVLEWLRGSDGTQKVLVFGHHKDVLDAIEAAVAKELKGTGHMRIDGTVNPQERAVRVRKFQESSRIRVAILSMTAAGVGLTLTAATTVMFAELHWTPGVLAQAEDRCHRIGQRNAVQVQYLVCRDPELSVDMQLWSMLGRKVGTLGRVVDGDANASLNAHIAEDGGVAPKGQSGQAELQSFFAETPRNESSKVPVKGTIMSFFQKQKEMSNATVENSTSPHFASKVEKVEWSCDVCTFDNAKVKPKSGWLPCDMCGTCYIDDNTNHSNGKSPAVTPPSSRKESSWQQQKVESEVVVLDASQSPTKSASTDELIIIDGCPKSAQKSQSTPRISSQDDPIVLDDDSPPSRNPTKRRLSISYMESNQQDLFVLDDSPTKESKQSNTSQTIVLEEDEADGRQNERKQVFALEGGVCRLCGIDAHALYTRICALQPAERLNALCNVNWKLPKTSKALDRLLVQDPSEGNFWQAGHIVALSEGGGGCGLDNRRTLCVPCHAGETERFRGCLRLNGGPKRDEDTSDGECQRDIRSMFQPVELSQKFNLEKNTKKRRLMER